MENVKKEKGVGEHPKSTSVDILVYFLNDLWISLITVIIIIIGP